MGLVIGIDVGGTFTDVAAFDFDSDQLWITKVPSTPRDPSQAFMRAVNKICNFSNQSLGRIERIVHGTTVGTNAIIERKGATIGILTTQGFEDILVMGRQKRSYMYDLFTEPETPLFLAPRRQIVGVPERIDAEGAVLVPLDEAQVAAAVENLIENYGVNSIAVCYLFSFLNPAHELRTREIIKEKYPHIRVTLSSLVDPRFREYERLLVTAFDAYIGPKVSEYFQRLVQELQVRGVPADLQIMQSSGGIAGTETALAKAVTTVLSGPSAGAIGGLFVGQQAGWENIITLDMGGTSSDVALIQKGKPLLSYEGKVENYPLRVPMIDVNTIGAGGGSIAWIDAGGALRVGPQSAGADPGPACYGNSGTEPTVTDASLVLGYLNPDYFASGELKLKRELAWRAIEEKVARPLGMDVYQAALGIHRIVNAKMADQLRLVTVKRGFDPRDFALVAMGGGGPVNAGMLARDLSISRVIVPKTPGVLSAFGLLVAQIQHEHAKTYKKDAREADVGEIMDIFTELDSICGTKMVGEKVDPAQTKITRYAEIRYVGQSYELEVQFPGEELNPEALKAAIASFHGLHDLIYGHKEEESPIEFVTLRTVHSFPMPRPSANWQPEGRSGVEAEKGRRLAYFEGSVRPLETPVYERDLLLEGVIIMGPAIVEQHDTTTVIYPEQSATIDLWGNLIIDIKK